MSVGLNLRQTPFDTLRANGAKGYNGIIDR